jgi:hypothetical protein
MTNSAERSEVVTQSARTGHEFAGIVDLEGGGTAPHPMGGGAVAGTARGGMG